MKLMHIFFPPLKNLKSIPLFVLIGILIGGVYGILHDQVTYSISPEYFTRFKFYQFHFIPAEFPDRIKAGMVGFIATCSMGMFAGWFIARIRFNTEKTETAKQDIYLAFLVIIIISLLSLLCGYLLGYKHFYIDHKKFFFNWERVLSGNQFKNFSIVGYMHNASYIGGFIGIIIGSILMKLKVNRLNKSEV